MGQQTSLPKITDQDKAIFQLKQQRDKLKQYQKKLAILISRQSTLAKQSIQQKQLDKARFYLRSKKQQESIINKTYNQLDNLENLISTIEFKLIEKDVLYGLSEGNKVLSKLNNEFKIEKIDKILDDLEENKVKVEEISGLLGTNLTNSEEFEVEDEFNQLDKEVNGIKEDKIELPDTPKAVILPDVPKEHIKESGQTEVATTDSSEQPIAA